VLNQELRGRIDREYTAHPFYGSRRMTAVLRRAGYPVNRKRVMRLQAIYPKPATSTPHPDHQIYPYLLRGVTARFGGLFHVLQQPASSSGAQ